MNKKLLSALVLLPLFLVATIGRGQQADPQARDREAEALAVERDPAQGTLVIKLPTVDGKIAWEDVLRALLRVGHLDDNALDGKFPTGSLDLTQPYSRLSLAAINLALSPDIRIEVIDATQVQPASLMITVDEDAIQARKRKLSKTIRDRVTGGSLREGQFGLRIPQNWETSDPRQLLTIVVHGFNSSPERFVPLVNALTAKGIFSTTYSYPDDQPISQSAEQLAADLRQVATDYPQRPVALVTHSMGGLVARAAIEQADLDPGNVTKLIMVAPPSQGSLLAYFAFGIDILDQASDGMFSNDVTRFYAAIEDGLSEAKDDLKPLSPLLRKLNALPRNPRVRYSIFLGTGGHLQQSQVDDLRQRLRTAAKQNVAIGLLTPRLDEILADLDEVIAGKGDGVVAVKRGWLEGVSDTVVTDFTHLGVVQSDSTLQDDEVFQGILQRLQN